MLMWSLKAALKCLSFYINADTDRSMMSLYQLIASDMSQLKHVWVWSAPILLVGGFVMRRAVNNVHGAGGRTFIPSDVLSIDVSLYLEIF